MLHNLQLVGYNKSQLNACPEVNTQMKVLLERKTKSHHCKMNSEIEAIQL